MEYAHPFQFCTSCQVPTHRGLIGEVVQDDEAPATLANYARRQADARRSAEVEFIWRSWRYFDVYAGQALIKDVAFATGALRGSATYTLSSMRRGMRRRWWRLRVCRVSI